MKIGIIVAMDSEYERLSELIGPSGRLGRNTVILSKSGIGKVNSALGTDRMIREHHPDCILSTGVAGGLGEGIDVMDVVAGIRMTYHDTWCGEDNAYGQVQGLPLYFEAHPALVSCVETLRNTPGAPWIHCGLICSGDRFIADSEEEEAILGHFPEAVAVDMESCSIAQVCHLEGVPFISLRVISDSLKGNRGESYADFWATVGTTSFSAVRQFLESLPDKL
ncbi:MAG: 5'-methylthioadenosine/S-adenosylhomocysteine nucleosidase [Bacteroidales bacterium]|nr:5'-methylthioadenosine/S-adenosylhomocysteine nucleosidase [Bacteroidales bacterium]